MSIPRVSRSTALAFTRWLIGSVLIGLLLGCPQSPPPIPPAPPLGAAAPLNSPVAMSPQIQFQECAAECGISVEFRDGAESGLFAIVESLGGGVGVLDYDRDGWPDLYFPTGGQFTSTKQPTGRPSRLFRQRSTESAAAFTDVSGVSGGAASRYYSHGVAVSDYDNDGFDDLLVTGYGGLQLFHNQGDGTFLEVSDPSGLTDDQWSSSAAWGDFNGDGANDLYVAHYVDWSPTNDPPCYFQEPTLREVCPPRRFQGLRDILYLSDGAGHFHSPPENAFGVVSQGKGLGVVAADIDLDGDTDLYVTNDTTMNSMLVNDGQQRFAESGNENGTGYGDTGQMDGSMGVDVGDYNRDGLPDIWVTNYENETFALYRSVDGQFFQHASRPTGISAAGGVNVGWGTVFGDWDQDGDEDLFIGNGHVIRNPTNSPVQQRPLVLRNEAAERYVNVAPEAGEYTSTPHMARGVARTDLDRDGDLDLVVSHINQPAAILRNSTPSEGHWIEVELIGTRSPRWAEGAWVEVYAVGEKPIIRLQKGGSSYASSSDRILHAGLGTAKQVDKLIVHWPSGGSQTLLNVPANSRLQIVENAASKQEMKHP